MSFEKASENGLISDLRSGKPEALTEIFRRYWKPLYLSAFYRVRSHELAEEIVQELFTDLWDKRQHLLSNAPEEVKLSAYLQRAVRNKVLNHLRKLVYDQRYWEYCKGYLPSSESKTHELAEYNDLEGKLKDAMDSLSGKTREIFVLHKLKGIPVGQISRELKLSEKAVGYHLTKSVRQLKIHLRDFI